MISEDTVERIRLHQFWYPTEARSGRPIDDCRDFSGANLADLELMDGWVDSSNFVGSTLRKADLAGAILAGCELGRAWFERTKVAGTVFTGAHWIEAAFVHSIDIDGVVIEGENARAWLLQAAAGAR